MRVFVTGATGFIGSALVSELVGAGHQVLGLVRSDVGAEAVRRAGAQPHRGDLQDLASLRSGAAEADAVVHTAFIHEFSRYQENCEIDRRAISALGDAMEGSGKLLIVTSGTGISRSTPGAKTTENDPPASSTAMPRAATEEAAAAVAERGVRVAVVRLPQVHDTVKQGLVTYAIEAARQKGVAAYVGEGRNRWPAAHRLDTAHLYRLALDKGEAGIYHAVAEEGVPAREIAEAIGRGLQIPAVSIAAEEAAAHFGWLGNFMQWDVPASSEITRHKLGWQPTGPSLLTDLANMNYYPQKEKR